MADPAPGRTELWVHPVPLARDGARQAERMARCGITGVRLAGSYHAGRWLLTAGSPGEVAHLDDSVPSFPVSTGDYGRLRPPPSVGPAGFAETAAVLRAAGLGVTGWLVALHNSPLATAHPDLALRNVFGTPYRHALCPAQPEVVAYAVALARDLARQDVDALDVEALGYLGWAHAGHHEKVGVPLRPVDVHLLSLCVCPACRTAIAAHGGDPDRLADRAARAVRAQVTDPRPESDERDVAAATTEVLGVADHAAVRAARAAVVLALVRRVAAAVAVPLDLRTSTREDEHAGKATGDVPGLAAAAGAVTVTSLTTDLRAVDGELRALDAAGVPRGRTTVGLSLMHPHVRSAAELVAAREHLAAAGVVRTCWYGHGLAAPARLDDLGAAARRAPATAGAAT